MSTGAILDLGAPLLRAALLVLGWALAGATAAGPEPVLDAAPGAAAPLWIEGVTELSGAIAADGAVASGLLAGEAGDCRVSVSLRVAGTYSGTSGVVFGARGAQQLWLAGYSPHQGRFELLRQSADGLELLAAADSEVSPGTRLNLELRVTGPRVVLASDGREVLAYAADQPIRGQVGIGAVEIVRYDLVFEAVRITQPDGTPLYTLPSQGELPWVPFRAAVLSEGTGTWGRGHLILPPTEWRDEGPRAALLLDPVAPGERFRQVVEVRNHTGFHGLGSAGLVFGYRDTAHYNLLGLDPENARIELWHRSAAGFEPLASARFETEGEWLAFGIEAAGDRVRVQAGGQPLFDLRDPRFVGTRVGLASYGVDDRSALWRKADLVAGGNPLPPKEPDDLLALALGARALLLEPPELPGWEALIDHPIGMGVSGTGEALELDSAEGPLAAVFAFPHQRLARIEQLEVQLAGEGEVGPVRFLSGLESPLAGFTELAVLHPAPGRAASLAVDPVTAKYLRIELPAAAGKSGQLAEVQVRGSLLGRAVALRAQEPAVATASDRMEREANDTPALAMRLPPAVWIGGSAGFGDLDYYRLQLPAVGGRLVVSGKNLGKLPAQYELLDPDGRLVAPAALAQSATDWTASYALDAAAWHLRVSSAPLSLTVLFDDSGSMGAARDLLPKLLFGLADRVGPSLRLKLMKYAEAPVEIFDFVADPKLLRAALEREVQASGGTETLAGLVGGLESLREVPGNRALLVALDGVDGYADPAQYQLFWQALAATAAPVYIVGIGSDGWDSEDRALGLSDRNFLSEVAWASRGQFLINPTVAAFEQGVSEVLAALTGAVPYQVRAEFTEGEVATEPQGQGSLQLLLAPGADRFQVRTVELVLDASNSMWGQVGGRSKIEIAREVLGAVLAGLPEGVHLGLRLYGHRWPRTDRRACSDSELVFPVAAPDRAALLRLVQGVMPKGRTPLVYSLMQTAGDFPGQARGTVILVSDGIESCDGQIEDVAQALRAQGIELTVHIVGFDVRERGAREELERIAQALGGRYFDAADAAALTASLQRTLRVEYEVLDSQGGIAARGLAGDAAVTLPTGAYRLRILLEPVPYETAIRVLPGSQQVLTLARQGESWQVEGH